MSSRPLTLRGMRDKMRKRQVKDMNYEELLREDIITRTSPWQGNILKIEEMTVTLPNGGNAPREVARHPGAVCVIPMTDEGDILVERQWRMGYGGVTLEIPAGKLDGADEDPFAAAKRELREETGAVAAHWSYLGEYYGSPAILDEKVHMYAAWGLTFGETDPDEDEFLTVQRIPLGALVDMALNGELPDGKTQAAVMRLHLMQERGLMTI